MEKLYRFNKLEFDQNGTNLKDGEFFLHIVGKWEQDFHDRYSPFYSNCLFANFSSMITIKNCFVTDPNEDCGFDLVNGSVDVDTNQKMEEHSQRQTIYAIGSRLDMDEPMWLVRDESLDDGMVILKYIPDDNEYEDNPIIPVDAEKIRVN